MSAVTLLTAGAKADSGVGSAIDVTGCATLKLTATLKAWEGSQLRVVIDTASTASGPWREIFAAGYSTINATWPEKSAARIVVQPDNFVRARWEAKTTVNQVSPSENLNSAGLNLAISGVGSPDA